ncbi:AbrB/MazE/SpoVT family DNA-binding domain-containing protein [Paenibacillus sp. GP183]|uniref:AbrB/MazE/SpoVT family DNA-binding domain-containing protein n=1 Tax=Paenibacillus sp. GP183 TaxID=1882751 RepID=UPI000894A035|nr:AbrB/MazE/SpoVT family DNA-binding domain-containing protein [Paenibacillus sp. GP183]SED14045.1 looped-hinge helix DNA binding domain-containing protein, AbrB family [Paenibacillus sp. GP183]
MYSASLTSKGQITIPKKLRDHLGLNVGSVVDFTSNAEGEIIMSKATPSVMDLGYRVFYRDKADNYFECFADKTRKSIDREWLDEKIKTSRKDCFKALVIGDDQVSQLKNALDHPIYNRFITEESVKFYRTYGLITD